MVILSIIVAALGLLLLRGLGGSGLIRDSYDTLHWLSPGTVLKDSPVVIVYLDRACYETEHVDPKQTWPRELHGKLLDRLSKAQPRAVVFDILFAEAGANAVADQSFADAIKRSGVSVLAGEYNVKTSSQMSDSSPWVTMHTLTPPLEQFSSVAAAWGVALQRIDSDMGIRGYLAGLPESEQKSLTWAAAAWLNLPVTKTVSLQDANARWIRYYGPPLAIPHTGYSSALHLGEIPDDFFRGKIVFVGARPSVETFHQLHDEFRNPFQLSGRPELFMPGVEVHATEMLNLIRKDWLRRLAPLQESCVIILCGLFLGAGLFWLRPIYAAAAALVAALAALAISSFGFAHGVWFPWLLVSAVQVPAALGGSVLLSSVEWYQARKRLEAGRRRDEAKIREQAALIDKAHDAILVQSVDGKIIYANPGAQRLYGWTLSELQSNGAGAELFSRDVDRAAQARTSAINHGEWNGELQINTRSGDRLIADSRWTLIRDESGKPATLLIINSDITEKKQLEAQFLRTQRMNTIGALAGGMAHDLNNALSPILMGVQLLRRKSNDEEATRLLSLMENNTHRSAEMVRQVLLFARGRGAEFEHVELSGLVKELERIVRETFPRNIQVETFLPRDLWAVKGNLTQLHQVLLNLCVNARDAMPQGGKLSFVADNVELSAAEAKAIRDGTAGSYVSLLVSDTGSGMPAEVRERIFEPFFTTKAEGHGTGIGLSTVLRIVKSHSGFLRVESEPGQGTAFEIFLPRAVDIAPATVTARDKELPRGNGELILVAEDEQAIRDLVSEGLFSHGYRVLAAANGEEALALFRQNRDDIALFFTDSAMPLMEGPKAIAAMRKLRDDLPVILASGQGQIENGDSSRGTLLLAKPFSLDDVLTFVAQLLPRKDKPKTF
jgi:PAS domain S-box-containing protein